MARFLAERMREAGLKVDADLAERAGLLHDLLRVCDFDSIDNSERLQQRFAVEDIQVWQQVKKKYPGLCHEEAAAELLKKDYPEVAQVIRTHKYAAITGGQNQPKTWEQKLVYYADKRVMHDEIVTLTQRLDEAHKRNAHKYGATEQQRKRTEMIDGLIFELEKEIFQHINIEPDDVTAELIDSYSR